MKRLYVLRHAKSDWDEAGLADHDRPLAARGRKGAGRLAAEFARLHLEVDVVLCSTARRARDTLDLVRGALPESTEVYFERRLYGAGAEDLIDRLHGVPDADGSVMLVGHNPGLEDLVLDLAPTEDAALVARVEAKFPTAAFATIDLAVDHWVAVQPGTGTLVGFVTPSDLG